MSAPLRCFLLEDSPTIRAELTATLEEMLPLQVLAWADTEDTALDWLAEPGHGCELILIDLFLKRGSGMNVLAQLGRLGRLGRLGSEAKRVVLSNYTTPDVRKRCLALGADRVFDKSGEIDELIDYCRELAAAQPH